MEISEVLSKRLHKKTNSQVTIDDVANQAGVSTATVSRVLNNPSSVSEELRSKVEGHIKKLGYLRHGAARSLRSQQSFTIGAIIPTLKNAIFAAGIEAFERELHKNNYTLLIAVSNYDPDHEFKQLRRLLESGVDGVMLVGMDHSREVFELLETSGITFVTSWTYSPDAKYPCVGFNNYNAAYKITEYLLGLDHKRIAMIAAITKNNDRARERLHGVRSALQKHNLDLNPSHVIECKYGISEGRNALRALCENDEIPTAIVCGNDILAYGALFECSKLGINVPKDLSIVGFDDLPLSAQLTPALTTIHVPSQEMGKRAAEHLLLKLSGKTVPHATEVFAEIIVRETTAHKE